MDLYQYQHSLLPRANVQKDPAPVREAAVFTNQLREAWANAAPQVAGLAVAPGDEGPRGG